MNLDGIRGRRQSAENAIDKKLDDLFSQIINNGSDDPLVLRSEDKRSPLNKKTFNKPFPQKQQPKKTKKLRVIPLGGLEEVGKNSMVFEYSGDIVVIDMGFQFPDEDLLGIDYVVPDVSYLEQRQRSIKGIIITHGHLDHIGGLRYVLPKLGFPPVYATKLTIGLIKKQLDEFGLIKQADLNVIDSNSILKLGHFEAKFFRVNHSIPDGVGVYLKSPAGSIVHTGDFKFDPHPADDKPAEIDKMQALGMKTGLEKVSVLFSDSTNSLKPGSTVSEKVIGESLDRLIATCSGRIIIASFSSLIGRIQQIFNSAAKHGRYVSISGRSMDDNISIASELGYLKIPKGILKPINQISKVSPKKVLIITTGSQGEAMSALTRMSLNDHKHFNIRKGDTVVISANPIIGNEKAVSTVINNLCKLGANVVNNEIMDVHTSGHASQEDLLKMICMVKPKHFSPIHGDLYMRMAHAKIAAKAGLKEQDIVVFGENGSVMEIDHSGVRITEEKVPSNYIVVDGLGMGDVGSQVLSDRQVMAHNGILVVLFQVNRKSKKLNDKPLILTRGFLYMNETDEIIGKMKKEAEKAYKSITERDPKVKSWDVCNYVKRVLDNVAQRSLDRRPLIVPWIMNV